MSDSNALVSINPSSILIFKLERETQPRAVLHVTNISPNKILFKVKTTQPNWYYVRPNQQVLDVGQTADVTILLVESECNRYLDQIAANVEVESTDKHRFLVQTKTITDEEFLTIKSPEEISKLWDGTKDDKKSFRLKVEFKYQKNVKAPVPAKTSTSVIENVERFRERLGRDTNEDTLAPSSPEVMLTELQNLRKKYDAVVEYTVHLTAERDTIVTQLEELQRELNREKSKRKDAGNSGGNRGDKVEKKVVEKGFSLFVVLITALICFLIGKYLL